MSGSLTVKVLETPTGDLNPNPLYSLSVIKNLNISCNISDGLLTSFVNLMVNQLIFSCEAVLLTQETLHRCIIIAWTRNSKALLCPSARRRLCLSTFSTHRTRKAMFFNNLAVLITAILNTCIRMHNQASSRAFILDGIFRASQTKSAVIRLFRAYPTISLLYKSLTAAKYTQPSLVQM